MKKILQAFKRWRERKKKVYICDPDKAVNCLKDGCWIISNGPCKCTMNRKYAKIGADGKPVIATDMDIWNEEWMESQAMQKFQASEESQKKQGLL